MTATTVGALATAAVLGVTHAIEPDHVAGIASLAGETEDSRLAALAGACFAAGHVALVAVWLVAVYLLLDVTAFPSIAERAGTAIAALVLGVLGFRLAIDGIGAIRRDEHAHGEREHSHLHLPAREPHDHGHGVRVYLEVGLVGALFTLSPPASMIAFASTILPSHGVAIVSLAVLAYAVGIVPTMSALGAGAGTTFERALDRSGLRESFRAIAGLVIVGFAGRMLLGTVAAPF